MSPSRRKNALAQSRFRGDTSAQPLGTADSEIAISRRAEGSAEHSNEKPILRRRKIGGGGGKRKARRGN